MNPQPSFSHEKLIVYQKAICFVAWSHQLITGMVNLGTLKDQFERASNSVALNIAEGNGKRSPKDRAKYWQIAHGSALECAACLDVLVARKFLTNQEISEGKTLQVEVVNMLVTLIDKLDGRLQEESVEYQLAGNCSWNEERD